jgi:hypothetical protein
MFGGYIADKLYRHGENVGLRILIVEAGSFLVPTHVQNLPRLNLNAPSEQIVRRFSLLVFAVGKALTWRECLPGKGLRMVVIISVHRFGPAVT